MELKSTLRVFNEAELEAGPAIAKGQTGKLLAGVPERPSERLWVALANFEPGTYEDLHWHPTEVFYYVISGRALMKDIEGNSYDIGPGSVIYAPAGIAGSHDWDIKEALQLLAVRATADPMKIIQFSVDEATKTSSIKFDYLIERGGAVFKSFY
jgi:quercetin dioxygenase-like cupin family protein